MTDDQKPIDDDLSFDDVPVVPEEPRALEEGDDFLDEVEEPRSEADFPTGEGQEQEPDEGVSGFAVHHGGAELFGGRPSEVEADAEDAVVPAVAENSSAPVEDGNGSEEAWADVPAIEESTPGPEPESTPDASASDAVEDVVEIDSSPRDGEADFDDVFVIEFEELGEAGEGDVGADVDESVDDLLLTPMTALEPAAPELVARDASSEFREDHAGWPGEDLPLGEFIGERAAAADDSMDLFEEDGATDEDPFAIDEVELEVEEAEVTETADDTDSFFEPAATAEDSEEHEDDAWAPLADGESWVLGADLGVTSSESSDVDDDFVESEEGDLAPVFGMGRFDPSFEEDDAPAGPDIAIDAADEADEPEYVDPIYGDVGAGIDEVDAQPYDEQADEGVDLADDEDYGDEFDETFVEQEPSHGRVIGVFRGAGRSPWAKVAAALLVSISAAGATVATMRPEWFGLTPGSVTPERVDVARPDILVEPVVASAPTDGQSETPTAGSEVTTVPVVEVPAALDQPPVVAVVPAPEPAMPPAAPLLETAPVTPVTETPSSRGEGHVESPVRPRPAPAFVGFETRDGMEIHDLTEPVAPRVAGVQVVSPGERAFAQLRNAEIFVGVVKRVEAAFVTLDLEPGEVSLSRSALTTLTPLASTDATEMLAAQHGYVRLPTEARLWGQILRNSTNDDVILQTEDARIRVPRGSVVQLQGSDPARTALVDAQDDSWLDARIREQLRNGDEGAAPGRSRRR
jgi:hypothetical protein